MERVVFTMGALAIAATAAAQAPSVRVLVRNELDAARTEEVVEVPAAALAPLAKPADLAKVHVQDEQGRVGLPMA